VGVARGFQDPLRSPNLSVNFMKENRPRYTVEYGLLRRQLEFIFLVSLLAKCKETTEAAAERLVRSWS